MHLGPDLISTSGAAVGSAGGSWWLVAACHPIHSSDWWVRRDGPGSPPQPQAELQAPARRWPWWSALPGAKAAEPSCPCEPQPLDGRSESPLVSPPHAVSDDTFRRNRRREEQRRCERGKPTRRAAEAKSRGEPRTPPAAAGMQCPTDCCSRPSCRVSSRSAGAEPEERVISKHEVLTLVHPTPNMAINQ
jgi:hypothetical protein